MKSISPRALSVTPLNKDKYNGKDLENEEFADGTGSEVYDYGARMYDPQIGRWQAIDPLSESYYSFSPYNYVLNNPLIFIDPDGNGVETPGSVDPPKISIPLEFVRDYWYSQIDIHDNSPGWMEIRDRWSSALRDIYFREARKREIELQKRLAELWGTNTGNSSMESGPVGNFTIADAKTALRTIFDKYGREMAETVEKMYRIETYHFTSGQYRRTGTGGMEVHGPAPYYGWNANFYEDKPVGVYSMYENKGLSGVGGNAQVTNRPKQFVVMQSVSAAMIFKANYINGYGGNYARWFSTSAAEQAVYRQKISNIIPKIVNKF
jgi:RHS repeat-associated protein